MEYTKEEKLFYEKEFTCGETTICRGDLESLPCPFCTENVTDETMQALANLTEAGFVQRTRGTSLSDDTKGEIWWEELEDSCRYLNIPYYEDLED